ncbi:MAG: DUF427 domain-containing protein [Gammaproteobacteria bacterium]
MDTTATDVTLVRNAIHNPADPRHFMRVVPCEKLVVATLNGRELARSTRATLVKEVGYDIYDPVIYFPREDVDMASLRQGTRSTHCPLKGDTAYFDAIIDGTTTAQVGWSYVAVIEQAAALRDLIAFDRRLVDVSTADA